MWLINNRTPFAAGRSWVRGRDGTEISLIVLKATFDIAPDGTTSVAKDQPPPLMLPVYGGEAGSSSLRYEADLILTKTTTDVIVVGHAYAPEGRQVEQLDVGFRVGPIKKVLRIFGDRYWGALGASSPEPFSTMPLVYERAFGGVDTKSAHPERDWEWRNPVGTGFATSGANAKGLRLPNLENPQQLISSWSDRPAPTGVGPLCSHWQPRASFAGTYDDAWRKTRQPLLPDDFDERFFQCAPTDQQAPAFLHGGEPVVMLNMTPGGDLRFHLPKAYFGFETRFSDRSREVHKWRKLHTVILEPDVPRVSMVWHSALPCHFRGHKLIDTLITQKMDLSTGEAATEDLELELA